MRILVAAASLLAATLQSGAPAISATERASEAGVWEGSIGNLPVQACFNVHDWGTTGGYYYRSRLRAIALQQSDEKKQIFVEGVAEPDPATPRWLIERVDGGSLAGTWKKGANTLPIALKRLELKEKESPCASMLFQGPRLEGVRTIKKPAMKDGVSYTRLILDHRGHFDKDIQVESFALNEEGPAAHAINAELRKQLNGVDSWFECIRMAWDLGSDGYTGQTIFPRMISKRWLVVMDENGWFCGGAHPDDANTPHLFDRLTGKEVDALQWFNAKAVKREKFEGDPDSAEMLQPAFRNFILSGWKPQDDCGESVRDADFWDAELTRTGFVFTPGLAHVEEACEEPFRVPFAKLMPYLTPEGRRNVAALQAEAATKR